MAVKKKKRMGAAHGPAPELRPIHIRTLDEYLDTSVPRRSDRLKKRALFYLGLGSGMRIGEMTALQIKHVMRQAETWKLHDPIIIKDQILLTKHITKNKKSRIVDITPQAQEHLHTWIDFLLNTRRYKFDHYVFFMRSDPDKPIDSDIACHIFRRWGQLAGIDRLSTHSMRRTHANSLRRMGVDIKIIKEQLGHSSLAMTDAYLYVDPIEKASKISQLKF